MPVVSARERAHECRVILLRRQAPDREDQGGSGRQPEVFREPLRPLGRKVVDLVADRHEPVRGKASLLEKGSDRVGDGDDAAGRAREGVVDVAERAEQIAIVVVP